eukprot:UN16231
MSTTFQAFVSELCTLCFEGISLVEIASDQHLFISNSKLVSDIVFKTRANSDTQILLTITSSGSTDCEPIIPSVTFWFFIF